jgi:FtsZ-binding cell division protein ZapB
MFAAKKTLPMDVIRIDGGTQSRVKIRTDVVDDYAEHMAAGAIFPPGVAFFDGKEYWLADGFHRYHALRKNKKASMECNIVNGTVRDAILYSYGANGAHGLPMSNEDKWHIVSEMLADFEWGEWSDREIARKCYVSHVFVGKVRATVQGGKKEEERKFKTASGKTAKMKVKAKKEETEPVKPKESAEVIQLQEQVEALIEEVDSLTKKLAKETAVDPEFAEQTIDDLREENKQLRLEVKSLTISRDSYQAENAQLIKQVNYLNKKIKKLSPA